jgi:hypothetical protein
VQHHFFLSPQPGEQLGMALYGGALHLVGQRPTAARFFATAGTTRSPVHHRGIATP